MAPEGRTRILAPVCIALVIGLALAGCLAPTHGDVAVYIKAQGGEAFTEVELTMTRVEIVRAGAGIGDGQDPTVDRGAGENPPPGQLGIVTITRETSRVDLLQFQDPESRAFLGINRVAEGSYSELIIRVTEATGILREDGSQVNIRLAVGEIRQLHEFAVEATETTRLIIELDLERSITEDDEGYRFGPRVSDVQTEPRATGDEGDIPDRGA